MKVRGNRHLVHQRSSLKDTGVDPRFAQRLKDEFGDKPLLSLDDARIEKVQQALRDFSGDANKFVSDTLGAMGEDWGYRGDAEFWLTSREGITQRLSVALEDFDKVELQTQFQDRQGRRISFHEETLTRDGSGKVTRSYPEVAVAERPPVDELCQPVDHMFSDPFTLGSTPELVRNTYYAEISQTSSLSELVEERRQQHSQLLENLQAQGKLSAEQATARSQSFGRPVFAGGAELDQVKELEQEAFHLLHHPQSCGDGLYRTADFYVSPKHLALQAASQGWETQQDEAGNPTPVADTVVIGGGPGGLSTALQLARRGARVVTFEAELAGAAFSDAGAKPVHHLRTSGYQTNLVRDGFDYLQTGTGLDYAYLEHPASLLGRLDEYGHLAEAGRKGLEALTGQPVPDVPEYPHGYGHTSEPTARGVLFAHLAKVAEAVATESKDSFLCERSPVDKVSYEDGLFTVTTARGHKVKARNLVVATGLTGIQGANARQLPVLKDFAASHPQMFENLSDPNKLPAAEQQGPLLLNERSLGNQAIRQSLAALPEGSRAAMVGSGESALKGAIEMLSLNPNLSVDLFVKGPIESAQVQIPPEYFFQPDSILATADSDVRARTESERFGTPLTPRTLQLFFEYQKAGRARLLELEEYFDADSARLSVSAAGKVGVEIVSDSAKAALARGEAHFRAHNLLPESPAAAFEYDAVVQAVGFKPPAIDQLSFLKDVGLPEEAAEQVFVNTTGAPEHQMQTTIPGLAIKGRMIAEQITARLPAERVKELRPKQLPGVESYDYRSPERMAEVPYYLEKGGVTRDGYERSFNSVRRDPETGKFTVNPDGIAHVVLTEGDPHLRRIYSIPDAERTPAQRETLRRGLALAERMRGLKLPPVEDLARLRDEGKLRETIEGASE